jgi:ATP-dependent RNA helicase RhlE
LKFTEFGFEPSLMEGVASTGYEDATPVQEQVIPLIMNGKDIIASAQTGTGKTAAFLLPLIHHLITQPATPNSNQAIIIVPTRELAIQIAQNLEGLSYFTPVSSIAVYGGGDGKAFVQEKQALSEGVDIVICTPGKLMGHIKMGYVKLDGLRFLVLDEADQMLNMGFYDDIMFIIEHLPKHRQNLLFSATMPPRIRELARKILTNPSEINIAISKPPEKIEQKAFIVFENQKLWLVSFLLREKAYKTVLIFCSSKISVKRLNIDLQRRGFKCNEVHSDLEQSQREQVLLDFRSGQLPIIVATDVLSRGIDIDNIELVINYDVPHDGEDYVHRIGRTARAAANGSAYTLVSEREQYKLQAIEKLLGHQVPRGIIPTELGETPAYNPEVRIKKPAFRSGNSSGGRNNNSRRPSR